MIETVDEWNNATFLDAFNECFSDEPQDVSDAIWQLIQDTPGHKALACCCLNDNSLCFIPFVFTSRNTNVHEDIDHYIIGIQRVNAFANGFYGDYSRQYSHSERAVGCFLFKNRIERENESLLDNMHSLLIKNQLETCANCSSFLSGGASFYIQNLDNIRIFFIQNPFPLVDQFGQVLFPAHRSWEILKINLIIMTSYWIDADNQGATEIFTVLFF